MTNSALLKLTISQVETEINHDRVTEKLHLFKAKEKFNMLIKKKKKITNKVNILIQWKNS